MSVPQFPLLLQSELMFAQFDGKVTHHAGYSVVRTPDNPQFYWGNFLIVHEVVEHTDWPRWREQFVRLIRTPQPLSEHEAYVFLKTPQADLMRHMAEQGFDTAQEEGLSLLPNQLRAPSFLNAQLTVRPLQLPQDTQRLIDLLLLDNDGFELGGYVRYLEQKFHRYAAMQEAGLGGWFGVFYVNDTAGEQLLGACGLYHPTSRAFGRFQTVMTHPQARRQGVCSTLIYEASRYAFERWQLKQLLMMAVPEELDGPAVRVYKQCGFETIPGFSTVELRAPQDRQTA